ncbi:AraC family transcriptional regulator [Anaerobacterium chartisolvens]|uniref:AraC family transcriptional regulator n=1 Tax=Anaerobacterium chartisolvens TaxID=1297424 RepID=A0A369ANL3_9FIRM|nr:AraC family transcriptional regulator [Anaerobacterium chartisolvens]
MIILFHKNKGYSSGFPIDSKIYNNISSLPHWHPELELMLVYEGSVVMGKNSECRELKKGDIAFCSGGDIHYYDSKGKHSTILTIVFRPELISNIVNLSKDEQATITFLDNLAVEAIKLDNSIVNQMRTCLDSIYKEMSGHKQDYDIFVKADLIKLFALFSRHIPRSAFELDGDMASPRSVKLIQGAMKYIESNYSHDISLNDISQHLKISPFYFSRIFSNVTGLTYKSYLNKIRIEKAHNFIETTSIPITDIAYECGYNSLRTFNRAFKELKGYTPSSLR